MGGSGMGKSSLLASIPNILIVDPDNGCAALPGYVVQVRNWLAPYGGSDAHTDIRSDIYSFGATLYHLLTNESPADARKRFLSPESLIPLRQINSSLSSRTEKAVLWAMSMHPDERPSTIHEFKQALLGFRETPTLPLPTSRVRGRSQSIMDYLANPPEATLAWSAAVLFLLSLIATLIR